MGKIKAILFDLDGTLINTLEDLAAATNYALAKLHLPKRMAEEFKMFAGNGIDVMLERAVSGGKVSNDEINLLKSHFLEYYGVHYADKTSAYAGLPELIPNLRRQGYLTAVVTNKVEEVAKIILDKLYPNCFDLIYGQRGGIPSKPDPTLTFMAMKELNVTPEECAFMGDSGVDIETAVNSGALPIGVLWGFRERGELINSGAKHIIEKPEQLNEILNLVNE